MIDSSHTHKTDWLASIPVFYNEKNKTVSTNIHDVIDLSDVEFDPDGFNEYLRFGYSVFGQTPVRHVKFLPHSSCIRVSGGHDLQIESAPDPAAAYVGRPSNEEDTLERIRASVRSWEAGIDGDIVIPTSGGYDSRLLNLMITDRSRVRSFTYGSSNAQDRSFEVVYARKISEILGTRWERVPLGEFHRFFDEWDALYGPSSHAHGMYQIESYRWIRSRVSGGNPVLSGIIGDAWAGSVKIAPIDTPEKVTALGYSHGIVADSSQSLLAPKRDLRGEYFEKHRELLRDPQWRVIEAMRFKLMLLSYLFRVPESYGFRPWSPFLDIELAMGMLNLPQHRREGRIWQKEFFRKNNLDLESMGLKVDRRNTVNYQGLRSVPLELLDVGLLREMVNPRYVEWINRKVVRTSNLRLLFQGLRYVRRIGGMIRLVRPDDTFMQAYFAYLVLKPIEELLKKREQLARGSAVLSL